MYACIIPKNRHNSDMSKPLQHLTQAQENRTLALAAIMQSVQLVDRIARKGICDGEDFQTCIDSLFVKPSQEHAVFRTHDIYGGIGSLEAGLRLTINILDGKHADQAKTLLTYTASIITLEKKLSKQTEIINKLALHMQRIEQQAEYFGSHTHESVIAAIANAYGETISQLKPRIIVRGKTEHLNHAKNKHKVRALLLAGIRAAHIWHQDGGNHLHLLLRRKKLVLQSQYLLEKSRHNT